MKKKMKIMLPLLAFLSIAFIPVESAIIQNPLFSIKHTPSRVRELPRQSESDFTRNSGVSSKPEVRLPERQSSAIQYIGLATLQVEIGYNALAAVEQINAAKTIKSAQQIAETFLSSLIQHEDINDSFIQSTITKSKLMIQNALDEFKELPPQPQATMHAETDAMIAEDSSEEEEKDDDDTNSVTPFYAVHSDESVVLADSIKQYFNNTDDSEYLFLLIDMLAASSISELNAIYDSPAQKIDRTDDRYASHLKAILNEISNIIRIANNPWGDISTIASHSKRIASESYPLFLATGARGTDLETCVTFLLSIASYNGLLIVIENPRMNHDHAMKRYEQIIQGFCAGIDKKYFNIPSKKTIEKRIVSAAMNFLTMSFDRMKAKHPRDSDAAPAEPSDEPGADLPPLKPVTHPSIFPKVSSSDALNTVLADTRVFINTALLQMVQPLRPEMNASLPEETDDKEQQARSLSQADQIKSYLKVLSAAETVARLGIGMEKNPKKHAVALQKYDYIQKLKKLLDDKEQQARSLSQADQIKSYLKVLSAAETVARLGIGMEKNPKKHAVALQKYDYIQKLKKLLIERLNKIK